MPKKAPHAVERAPQEELATLSQLRELVAMMERRQPQLTKQYMQDFLRFLLVSKVTATPQASAVEEDRTLMLMGRLIEQAARKYYPHAVNEILEIVAPFCNPNLRFDLEKPSNYPEDSLRKAAFWYSSYPKNEYHEVNDDYRKPGFKGMGFPKGLSFSNFLRDNVFIGEFETFYHLDPKFDEGARKILHEAGLSNHIHERYYKTGPEKYKITGPFEMGGWLGSIVWALEKAIVFATKDDKYRLQQVSEFLKFQMSGTPIFHFHEGVAHILCI